MADLIDADKLKRKCQKFATQAWKLKIKSSVEIIMNQFIDFINEADVVDAVPVVRCINCELFEEDMFDKFGFCKLYCDGRNDDDFCSKAVPK